MGHESDKINLKNSIAESDIQRVKEVMLILGKAENIQSKSLNSIYETYKELKKHLCVKARKFIKIITSS